MKTLTALRTFMCSWLLQASYSTAANIEAPGVPNPTEHATTLAPPTELDINDRLAKLHMKEENHSSLPIKPLGVSNPNPATLLPPIVSMEPETRAYLTELYKNEENCSDLSIKALVELVKQKVSITPKCFAKVQGIETMTVDDYKVLQNIRNLFSYYNGSLPAPVLQILSGQHVSTFGSELGQPIGQNLALELLGNGVYYVSMERLHGYYSSGQNDLDISKVFEGTLFAWIGNYPTDVLKVKPEYLHAIPLLSWETILSHPDCFTRPFLESLELQGVHLPPNLKIDKQSMAFKRTEPMLLIERFKMTNRYRSDCCGLSYCPLSTKNFVENQDRPVARNFFSNLSKEEAINILARDFNTQPSKYRYSIGTRWVSFIGLGFFEYFDWMSTDVCVIFTEISEQFLPPTEFSLPCRDAYIDMVIETKYIPTSCVFDLPSAYFEYKPEGLFKVLEELDLLRHVHPTSVRCAMEQQPDHKDVYTKYLDIIDAIPADSDSETVSSSD